MSSKPLKLGFAIFLLTALSLTMLAVPAYATPSTSCATDNVASGYAATSNYHGINVPLGTSVTVYACTTNKGIDEVRFVWHNPSGTVVYTDLVETTPTTVTDARGVTAYQWTNIHVPDAVGDWGVQTVFCTTAQSLAGCTVGGGHSEFTSIKATSFLVLSDLPFGTIAAVGVAFGGFFTVRRLSKSFAKSPPLAQRFPVLVGKEETAAAVA